MKFVGLLSGGKDSCFNLVHCAKHGHQLVAAASLGPGPGKEEIDSYLYQTVGQDAIHLVAQALDVPLYRQTIVGTPVQQSSEYGSRHALSGVIGDEAEDLYQLLKTVKDHHPDVEGVSVGAILSNYQRVRVEHVCRRLNLTPLAYLWQRDQAELLDEMINAGLEAILIKVAGIGLTVKHLGKTLAQMKPTLRELNGLYGLHICGEGGEYETLTLDCTLFKSRVQIEESEVVYLDENDVAPVAFLRIQRATLVDKPLTLEHSPPTPPSLTATSQRIYEVLSQDDELNSADLAPTSIANYGPWVSVVNVQAVIEPGVAISLEEEVRQCFHLMSARLAQHGLQLTDIANINVLLASMDDFAAVNAAYATYFGTSPPARACVAVDLPAPHRLRLDCVSFREEATHSSTLSPKGTRREALHVQGISYWAPANIGPYSQAIIVDQRMFISGQIGLLPSTLSLPSPPSLAMECALSMQHVETVVAALKAGQSFWTGATQMAVVWLSRLQDVLLAQKAWDTREKESAEDHANSPLLFTVVKSLPKAALVETQVVTHTGRWLVTDESDEESEWRTETTAFHEGNLQWDKAAIHWETSTVNGGGPTCALICARGDVDGKILLAQLCNETTVQTALQSAISVRLFYTVSVPSMRAFLGETTPTSIVPVRHLSTRQLRTWDYAIYILGG